MSSEDSSRISTWVPQVFFDLIARVVPGTITIGALVVASYGPSRVLSFLADWLRSPPENSPTILFVLLMLTLAYALSIILWGLWCLVARSRPETGLKDPEGEFAIQYDFIKKSDPQAGNRITKLKAEIHLSAVLVVGLILAFVVDGLWLIGNPRSAERWVLLGLLAAGIAGSVSSWWFFVKRTSTAVRNQCRLLCYEDWCSGVHAAGPQAVAASEGDRRSISF